jgi:hypothetical protein
LSRRARAHTFALVPTYLVELYLSGTDMAAFSLGAERARQAAEELSRQGPPVYHLRSIFVPGDETCFHLYEAASVERVREAAKRAGLPFERVSEAVSEARGEHDVSRVRRWPGQCLAEGGWPGCG